MQINRPDMVITPPPGAPFPWLTDTRKTRPVAQDSPRSGDAEGKAAADAPTVLLVDDNETTLARARSVLSPDCTVVGTATDGQKALEAAAALHPEVIVLDISMPGMNGFEVARRLRAAGSTAALVFLTVHEEEELIQAAKRAGAIGYVVKTRIASDLEIAVREARAGRPFQSPAC